MAYVLGRRSRAELEGVHPDLVRVVERAIQVTSQDFSVHDGIRTLDEQRELYRRGASRTLNSKHLPQEDGYGYAVDLVPYVGGRLRWEWPLIYPIAEAMRAAAEGQGVRLRWGGHWGELTGMDDDPEALVRAYVDSRRAAGKSAFIDGPHYELLP